MMCRETVISRSPPCSRGADHLGLCPDETSGSGPGWFDRVVTSLSSLSYRTKHFPNRLRVRPDVPDIEVVGRNLPPVIRTSGGGVLVLVAVDTVRDGGFRGARPVRSPTSAPAVKATATLVAQLDLWHDRACPNSLNPALHSRLGPDFCALDLALRRVLPSDRIGNTFGRQFFQGSPQEHAILNRHLVDYFRGRTRAMETTPYAIPTSQRHLLADLGMEEPQPDAPSVQHGLHKSIEEHQLRGMRNYLPTGAYGLISVKASKLHLLPQPATVQNPIYQAKDVSRYPGIGITTSHFRDHDVYFMHDVSSEVGPHELVERLDSENRSAQLFVTGVNPIEVVDDVRSFEPSSHEIDYDLAGFNYVFAGSASESYFTSKAVTVSWLRSSSIRASSGRVYQVVLLDYKLGHCLWHVFPGDIAPQDTRTFPTGSYVQLPAALTGTWRAEWLPVKLVSGVLSFAMRTKDLSTSNMAAKVAQLATSITPRMTSREHWVATHVAAERAPHRTWGYWAWSTLRRVAYFLTGQWHLLSALPDIYHYLDERKRYRVLHPTPGGGWTAPGASGYKREAIPNNPTWLQRLSAFTSAVFTFMIPKLAMGEVLSAVFTHLGLLSSLRHLAYWADIQPLRLLLTAGIVVVTSLLPGSIVKVFSRLAGHFWRQLWLPGWVVSAFECVVTEICGGPGARWFAVLPGRGWFWQSYLWALAAKSILPNLIPHFVLPWAVLFSPFFFITWIWLGLAVLENLLPLLVARPFFVPDEYVPATRLCSMSCYSWLRGVDGPACERSGFFHHLADSVDFHSARFNYYLRRGLNWFAAAVSPPRSVLVQQPAFVNLPPLPRKTAVTVKRRNVDIPLPAVTVQAARIPAALGAGLIAVDPAGMTFVEWTNAVERAYRADPVRYPALTPGQSCFWDCVAGFGGTSHMWYSWFMAYAGRVPDPNDPVVGNITQPDMAVFAAASQFGIRLSGVCEEVVQPGAASWPTVHMLLTHTPVTGLLHVELCTPAPAQSPQAPLARLLKTLQLRFNGWVTQEFATLNRSAVDAVPVPTPELLAMLGTHSCPASRNDVVGAWMGSYTARPLANGNAEGFGFDMAQAYGAAGTYPPLFTYGAPVAVARVGRDEPGFLWRRFRAGGGHKRVKVPADMSHPSFVPPKVGASGAQSKHHVNSNNIRPSPAKWTVLRNQLEAELSEYVPVTLPRVALAQETVTFTADLHRAQRLVADLKAHPSVLGPLGRPDLLQSLDSILDSYRAEGCTVSVPAHCYFGVWGSGKTQATRTYLSSLPSDIRRQARVVSHTDSLRAQAKQALDYEEFRGYNLPTLPGLLCEPVTGPVVFDDAGKFWGGVLDLVVLANPGITEVVVNGDPAQGGCKFPVAGTQSEYDPSPLHTLARHTSRYATVSHRAFRLLADTFGVYTTRPIDGHITHTSAPKVGLPVTTASPRYAGVLAGGGRRAYTYESIQGEDFDEDVEVDITGLEGAAMDATMVVALTRSKTGVYLHMDSLESKNRETRAPSGSDILNAIVYAMRAGGGSTLAKPDALVKAAYYRHLHWSMPGLVWFARIGASLPASHFQSIGPFADTVFPSEPAPQEPSPAGDSVTAYPVVDSFVRETHWHAKEDREETGPRGATDQFKDQCFVNPHVHKRADTATYFLSVEKRLKTVSRSANLDRYLTSNRDDMCDEYRKLVPEPPQWSAAKHAEYVDRVLSEYQSTRTEAAVRAKVAAHDPDRTGSDIVISLKNQVIKKDEKRHKVAAIPGQLIHEYDLSVTLGDAPFALFLEDEVVPAFPKNFLFYRRMNPDQFKKEYASRWRVGNGVYCSDVTRWDVGRDAAMLNFDVFLMHYHGFPRDYVEAYIERRVSSRSQHGPMGTMQNSGDRYTWVINSICRATVTSLLVGALPEDTVAINGDDAAVDRYCSSGHFPNSPWEFKDLNGPTGEFSGFELGGPVPTYSAAGLHYRMLILESRDPSAVDKWQNYLDLLSHADCDSDYASDIVLTAQRHMPADLFDKSLPDSLRHFISTR